ncbi:MAG TPA: DNA polymerase III subunit alpha, partial [Clostridia bacterium]|nr:DNA polymerase III subunit alpha [Clostridia bacterium]
DGIKRRYKNPEPEVYERMDYELGVIRDMGYVEYYLIVWDFIRFAHEAGIMVGPGRGSGAGSLVAYLMGITNIDPLKYNLLFERFLNPERISMPDFDVDFCYERRGEVIDYVINKYGSDHVAQIITFGTMAAKAAIRDVARAMDVPYAEADRIAKMIPGVLNITLRDALKQNPELKREYEENGQLREIYDMAMKLEGLPRHSSTHAAGVVITHEPVDTLVPLALNDGGITTQFTMKVLEQLGLLKMDFLGLRTLTVIRDTLDLIEQNGKARPDMDNLTYDDKGVFEMLSEGDTAGVFQLEGAGMTAFIKELKPQCLEDIIAGISLFRPGPMDSIPTYLHNKNNPDSIEYLHPLLEPILNVTYGCIVYQEQVMQIVRDIGGYSMGRS